MTAIELYRDGRIQDASAYLRQLGSRTRNPKESIRRMAQALKTAIVLLGRGESLQDALDFNWHTLGAEDLIRLRGNLQAAITANAQWLAASSAQRRKLPRGLSVRSAMLIRAAVFGAYAAGSRIAGSRKRLDKYDFPGWTVQRHRRQTITPKVIRRILDETAKDSSPAGVRDLAILSVLWHLGLRASELIGLQHSDYNDGVLVVKRSKNDSILRAEIANGARAHLDRWTEVRGPQPGPMFPRLLSDGTITSEPLYILSLTRILERRAKRAGCRTVFTCHDIRASVITRFLSRGQMSEAQALAGHANPATTLSYDTSGDERLQEILRGQDLPGWE